MRRLFSSLAMLTLLAVSLAAAPNISPGSKNSASKPYQIGKASWYGKQFHGRTTASGEPYDMFQFTAAHRQLPLGTSVKVTNMHNGRWVMVRVNDRGPVPESRIIDLSYGAAEMLFDAKDRGLLKVRLDIVQPEQVQMAQNLAGGE
ncbi:MAG: septal ring lytic transglycosylase RlpA family protein [Terriglobales bacterium]